MSNSSNALANETSPYLRQHAGNPVHWYPWGPSALQLAREQDKPVLLSIGYSACHWCHVMAHESFEDVGTAELMNRDFINIKVDREERPDLDKVYQLAHQLLTQRSGGWPLTVFLTPDDHQPFFAGTYFPKHPRAGMPTFTELLEGINNHYRDHRDELRAQNSRLASALAKLSAVRRNTDGGVDGSPIINARAHLQKVFDQAHGGFGRAPKFPHPSNLQFLLRCFAASQLREQQRNRSTQAALSIANELASEQLEGLDDPAAVCSNLPAYSQEPLDHDALAMVLMTTLAMGNGGMNDQLAGGFCRYSTDNLWMIPHFEKMLYDNGPLLGLCADLLQVTQHPDLARFTRDTANWARREMQSEYGGFFASIDADSEGDEGRYYLWQNDAVRKLVSTQEYAVMAPHYGLDRAMNFENRAWHLHVFEPLAESDRALLDKAKQKLLKARSERVAPARDDKILVSWNALMIASMARASSALDAPQLLDSAEHAVDFIRANMWSQQRLWASYKDGRAHLPAYLDDYAFLLQALLTVLQHRWRPANFAFAMELAEVILSQFQDQQNGGFFFTAHEHEALIFRARPVTDEAMPAGAAVAAVALQRLGHLIGNVRYLDAARRCIESAWDGLQSGPQAHCTLLQALDEYLRPVETVVLRGSSTAIAAWQHRALQCYAPSRQVFAVIDESRAGIASPENEGAVWWLRFPLPPTRDLEVWAYFCDGQSCSAPISEFSEFERRLRDTEVRAQRVALDRA